ncbi:RagB/SusD family nutrient uptake outer membrane protein [Hymenobacter sp. BT507]|uniref:RagB/SusD family nutrient uptake outer membrane protein n=1 Tax=Hymenobacter citatus TaxID=2763506 RepID=A0ABR7ME64_9BACT|nr:RagB/SusD family nutrient uptake outer membrane protein [Hymenobacter citatus]MBC6609376.1 RagB/SusD family nutrient uptake outer membrane protein [Hymenobacter citatus]
MKRYITRLATLAAGSLLLLTAPGCDLNIPNPNSASDAVVLTTRDGLLALSVGMRQYYANNTLGSVILGPGATARELRGVATFTSVLEIEAGTAALPNFNSYVSNLWSQLYRVMSMAEDLQANAPTVLSTDPATRDAVLAHANLFKAIALGTLAQYFEQAPSSSDRTGQATFVPRAELLAEAIRLLTEARQLITATAPSAEFTTKVTAGTLDLTNTINAHLARYNLAAGNYAAAASAAAAVNLSSRSAFIYNVQNPNPIYQSIIIGRNFRPRNLFGLPTTLVNRRDARLSFYLTNPTDVVSDPVLGRDTLRSVAGFFAAQTTSIPVYLPDEMRLIQAEAIVRQNGDLAQAVTLINAVRTQAPSADAFGVGASLPAYAGAVTADALLTEIYRQRAAELFMTGLRLPDSRRLGRPAPPASLVERTRNFYPYPQQERLTNPNVPADPAI